MKQELGQRGISAIDQPWLAVEIVKGGRKAYLVTVSIPTSQGSLSLNAFMERSVMEVARIDLTIPLAEGRLIEEGSMYRLSPYSQLYNRYGYNNRQALSLNVEDNDPFDLQAMKTLNLTSKNMKPFILNSGWGITSNSIGFTANLTISGTILTCRERFGFADIQEAPLIRMQMFTEALQKTHAWVITPNSNSTQVETP